MLDQDKVDFVVKTINPLNVWKIGSLQGQQLCFLGTYRSNFLLLGRKDDGNMYFVLVSVPKRMIEFDMDFLIHNCFYKMTATKEYRYDAQEHKAWFVNYDLCEGQTVGTFVEYVLEDYGYYKKPADVLHIVKDPEDITSNHRTCNKCNDYKCLTGYHKLKTGKGGYSPTCKVCVNKKQIEYNRKRKGLI